MFQTISVHCLSNKPLLFLKIIMLIVMTVFFIFHIKLDSMWLKQAILSYYPTINIPNISQDICELTIDGMNDLTGHLVIANYPNLISIGVSDDSLQNVASLKICDNPELQTITVNNEGCKYLSCIDFSSKSYPSFIDWIFLDSQHSQQGKDHLMIHPHCVYRVFDMK